MENSFREANVFAIIFNVWQCPFICKTYRQGEVKKQDLMRMKIEDDSASLQRQLDAKWERQRFKQKPDFMKAFHRAFLCRFLRICTFGIMSGILPPLYLYITKLFIDFIGDEQGTSTQGAVLFVIFTSLLIIQIIFRHLFFFYITMFSVVARKALTGIIYQKLLRLSQASVAKASPGKLINLASGDMAVIERGFPNLPYIVIAPISTVVTVILLYMVIGPYVLYTLIVIFVFYFAQFPINKYLVSIRLLIAQATDRRLNVINRLILGMRTIKSYTWEEPIINSAKESRRVECRRLLKQYCVKGTSDGVFRNAATLLWMSVILIKVFKGEALIASQIFTAMNMLSGLGFTTIFFLNLSMNSAAEYTTVLRRVEQVLLLEEIKDRKPESEGALFPYRVKLDRVTANWGFLKSTGNDNSGKVESTIGEKADTKKVQRGLKEPLLLNVESDQKDGFKEVNKDINFMISDGDLICVIGKVGAGKSSLLATVMGETEITAGAIDRKGRIAYVEQQPCILSDSVRNNITFGLPLDQDKLMEVIHVCQLEEDLKIFVRGLDTEIGERGVNISGGQKARLSLARACYSDADIYLLDDPLSAVDPNVAQKIFKHCITGYLASKARILVTHQLSFLNRVDSILLLENGRQLFLGSYADLKQYQCDRGSEMCEVLDSFYLERQKSVMEQERIKKDHKQLPESEDPDKKKEDLIVTEQKASGSVGWSTYYKFFRLSCGWFTNILVFLYTTSPAIMQGYMRSFITEWVALPYDQQQQTYYPWVYIVISISSIIISTTSSLAIAAFIIYINNKLHNKMLGRVARATILFFDSNPLGRIINRFSKDTSVVDGSVPLQVITFFGILWQCTMLIYFTVTVYPYMAFIVLVLVGGMFLIRKIALMSTMDCLRYDAITRSPINSMFSASLNGLMTIRAYQQEAHFKRKFLDLVDTNGNAFFTYNSSARWMAYYLDYVTGFFIICTIAIAFVLKSQATDPAYVALGITSALSLSGPFQYFIRLTADLANSMTSVQRMNQYAELPSEPPQVLKSDKQLIQNWPNRGELKFQNVVMRYREGFDPVLKNISFDVAPSMKVGVVGRTGAGKSSILQALFRLSEIEPRSKIIIDNIDTSKIGLKTLREVISIIPQSPFLFEGTVRENLDPFSLYTDEAIWDSLEDVQLKEAVTQMENGLQQFISEGTSVFSVGQKQLICLARAILRNNKILVLDEATANVDMDTDALIQQTIKQKFANCTVLTVAHRLDTIIESDRILVLSHGTALEFDHPHNLLQKEDGHFTGMVAATGSQSETNLRNKAEEAYFKTH